jgi:hypothetical protein
VAIVSFIGPVALSQIGERNSSGKIAGGRVGRAAARL